MQPPAHMHARRFSPVRYAVLVASIYFAIAATAVAQTPRPLSASDKRSIDETLERLERHWQKWILKRSARSLPMTATSSTFRASQRKVFYGNVVAIVRDNAW
jgi:hypothetical protein